MHDDELKALWREQTIASAPPLPNEKQLAEMKKRMSGLDRTLFWRNCRENVAAIFVMVVFGFYFFKFPAPIARAGSAITVLFGLLVIVYPLWRKRHLPKASPDASMMESLEAELSKVNVEIALLRSILWWYILPCTVGVLIFYAGTSTSIAGTIIYALAVVAMDVFIYWLNQRAVAKQLLPLKHALESLLHSAKTGEPLDQTHGGHLRSIMALSMPGADHVKPVEFKVAFWQLALFGEIGFVGMWVALMVGMTADKFRLYPHGIASSAFILQLLSWPHLLWLVLLFLAGLLYSRLIQKTTERAVGISPLGIHLCKGQTLILWDEIKDVRPFRFLHIRNLWLIEESGEKTRMHWTPLERHSDLKAAIENSAPANHPIRQHLSLLKPEPPQKNIMTKIILIGIVLISLGTIRYLVGKDAKVPAVVHYSDPVSQMLENIRVQNNFPALAAVVVIDGKIVVTNAVGFRQVNGPEAVTINDKFHIGSVTKSMTATVAAMLVEQGKISWTTTIGESFPELGDKLHSDYRGVTLEQLLSHRGGAPGDAPADLWLKAWKASGTPTEQRLDFVKGLLTRSPEAKPGTKHIYSNQGYAIAGVMLEKVTGKPWEELMRTMLFAPLGMTSAGFGAPATLGHVDQPLGHKQGLLGLKSVPPGPGADNPAAIGPAGTVHCSLPDLAAYAAFHMAGEKGGSKLLKADSFKKLHTSAGDDYALGWVVLKRDWAGDRALMHNGSNTMFYVVIWMAPDKNSAVIVATNVGSDAAFDGCDKAAENLIIQFFPK